MNSFFCPYAQRILLKCAVRSPRLSQPSQVAAAARWLSSISTPGNSPALQQPLWSSSRPGRRLPQPPPRCTYGDRRTFFGPKIIRDYEDLPRDYRDHQGLDFKNRILPAAEIDKILGPGLNVEQGNRLLKILHGRRVAGTLDDPAFAVHTQGFTEQQRHKALEYLRDFVPVDEVHNAGLRAEDELLIIEEEAAKAPRPNAASPKRAKQAPHHEVKEVVKPEPSPNASVYGISQFDKIRAKNVAKRKAEEKLLEEARRAAEERAEKGEAGPLASIQPQHGRQITNPKIAEYARRAQSDLEAPPDMKPWERILPSATFVFIVLGLLMAVSSVYEEPAPRYRMIPDISAAQATVGAIIAINVMVWGAWKFPPAWRLLNRYFLIIVATPRPVSMFLSSISHQKTGHILINMSILWLLGTTLHEEVGRADFLTLYIGCGSLAALGSLTTYTLRGMLTISSMGASAGIFGLLAAYFWENRLERFRLWGAFETGVPGIVWLALPVAWNLASLGGSVAVKLDAVGHLWGLAAGVVGIETRNWLRGKYSPQDETKGDQILAKEVVVPSTS